MLYFDLKTELEDLRKQLQETSSFSQLEVCSPSLILFVSPQSYWSVGNTSAATEQE